MGKPFSEEQPAGHIKINRRCRKPPFQFKLQNGQYQKAISETTFDAQPALLGLGLLNTCNLDDFSVLTWSHCWQPTPQ